MTRVVHILRIYKAVFPVMFKVYFVRRLHTHRYKRLCLSGTRVLAVLNAPPPPPPPWPLFCAGRRVSCGSLWMEFPMTTSRICCLRGTTGTVTRSLCSSLLFERSDLVVVFRGGPPQQHVPLLSSSVFFGAVRNNARRHASPLEQCFFMDTSASGWGTVPTYLLHAAGTSCDARKMSQSSPHVFLGEGYQPSL